MTEENKHNELQIFINDLTKTAQKEVLEFLGIKGVKEENLDVFPLTVIPKPQSD